MISKFGNFYDDFVVGGQINHALTKTIFESDLGVRTGIVSNDQIIDAVYSDELSVDERASL